MYEIGTEFIYGVHLLNEKKMCSATISSKAKNGRLIVVETNTNEVIGSYRKKDMFRHIRLSELYIEAGHKLNRTVFEFELATRQDKELQVWYEKGQETQLQNKEFLSTLSTSEQESYYATAKLPSSITKNALRIEQLNARTKNRN